MGFISGLISAAVKTVSLPLDVAVDITSPIHGGRGENSKNKVESILEDLDEALF